MTNCNKHRAIEQPGTRVCPEMTNVENTPPHETALLARYLSIQREAMANGKPCCCAARWTKTWSGSTTPDSPGDG